jgi:Leucine-rich repeat (LRR) protein
MKKLIVCLLIVIVIGIGCSGGAIGSKSSIPTQDVAASTIFPDKNLDAVVREAINKPDGDVTISDVQGMIELDANNKGITNLEGLEYCTDLQQIYLAYNPITDISPLGKLPGHTVIAYDNGNPFSYTKLYIGLAGTGISDISPLSNLTNPTYLTLMLPENHIRDLTPLSGLTNLIALYLRCNQIVNVAPLSNLTGLIGLELWGNKIEDVSPLSNLTNLRWLELEYNPIQDLSPLDNLVNTDIQF